MSAIRNISLGCAALLVLYAMQRTQPGYAEIIGPFVSRGIEKQGTATKEFEVQLTGFKAAHRLKTGRNGKTSVLTTDGIWVLVGVKAKASKQSLTLTAASWQGPSKAIYYTSDRLPPHITMLANQRLEPGMEIQGLIIFEIPHSELQHATLRLAQNKFAPLAGEAEIVMPAFGGDRIVDEFDLDI